MKHKELLPYRKSLVFRATLWLAVSSTMMVLFLAVLNTRFIQAEYTRMEEQKITTIMKDALKLIGINLSYGFEDAINDTGRSLLSNSNILSVHIVDNVKDREYEFSSSKERTHSEEIEKSMPVTDPATGKEIGHLTVTYFKEGYRKMMVRYYTNLAAIVLIFLLSIAFLVRFLFKRLSPLRQLADAMQSFSPEKGGFDLPLEGSGGNDEIAAITSASQAMVKNIEDYALRLEELNRQLQKSRDELEQRVIERTRELKQKQMQLSHAGRLAALGELAAGVAHELGQPLQIIKSASVIISEEIREGSFVEEEIAPIAQKITEQVDRAFSIISSMRKFARFQGTKNRNCATDLSEALEDALGFFKTQFRQHGIRLHIEIDKNLPPAPAEPQKFQQIAVNLLSNARYAVEKRAEEQEDSFEKLINVRLLEGEASEIILEVEDNGAGMSAEEQERCLEPFYTTKEPDQGTGLGLSIVYSIVREFGARLEVESEKGRGTLFRMFLKSVSPHNRRQA